jgi:serine/threonine protein kinase
LHDSSASETAPTVISSMRSKPAGADAQHAESLIGRRLGHFELIESVGVGGMAAVIKATDLDLGRTVALKILPPDMATEPENVTRFKQEARAAAKLDHENVARVYFCGEDQGLHFIAFEFVEGENLRVRMEKQVGLLPVADSLHYMIQVTAGLSHAASRGVVHRDIKPSNIIITPEGKAKIVDMGLARNLDTRTSNGQLTQSGITLGTFDYISPEQAIEPRTADCRSDIYSLGCTFYHMLTGRTPVPEGTAAKKLHCHQHVAPLDPRELNPAVTDELAAVLSKMMAKDPNQRYQHPDHLLQHLLMVAEQLHVPTEALKIVGDKRLAAYFDRPLPQPPFASPFWIAAAVIVFAVGLIGVTGGFSGPRALDSQPFWQNGKTPKDAAGSSVAATDDGAAGEQVQQPAAAKGPQEARNASELVSLLRQTNVHIKLKPNIVYDLMHASRKEAELPQALFEGTDLTLECDRLADRPTVRLLVAAPDDGKTPRPGSLTIRGPSDGSTARVHLRGIRFECVFNGPEPGQTGVSLLNVDEIDVDDCSFVPVAQKIEPENGPAVLAIQQEAAKDTTPEARIRRCWFAPGCVAMQLQKTGWQRLQAVECAFGPQHAVLRVGEQFAGAETHKPAEINFTSCSMLMTQGAVVEIEDDVPCHISASWCLFSNPELAETEAPRAFAIHQLGMISSDTRFEGGKSPDGLAAAMPNGYHNVLAYANGDNALTFEQCKQEQAPVEDAAARTLTKSPWEDEHPLKRLANFPRQIKQVFRLDLKQEVLRLEPDKNHNLLGTKHLPGASVYDLFPFGSPQPDIHLAANTKIWQPDFPKGRTPPANVYQSLDKAVLDLKKGDVILIRHNGDLDVDLTEFPKPDTDVTIRPDENYQPVLIPKAPRFAKDTALFKLYFGQIVLENLRFRLKPDRARAILAIPGGGQCTFRNCSITLEEADDLCVVTLADPRVEMMMGMNPPEKWPTPRIVVENSFIRGRGRLLSVLGSRQFDLYLKGSLAVLDGSLINVEPSADHSETMPAQVTLDHVTTYLTRNLVAEKASEKRADAKGVGLAPLQVHPTNCLFVPAGEQAFLVSLDRIDSMEQMESVFDWKDARQNVYGFKSDQVMLLVQPENMDTAMRLERIDRDRWLGKWREAEYVFGDVNFSVIPAGRRFDGVKPGDFEVKSITNPPLKPEDPTDIGAPIETLRKLAGE